jgi:hypothetical protein
MQMHTTRYFDQSFSITYSPLLTLWGPVPLLDPDSAMSNETLMAWLLYYGQSADVYSLTRLTTDKDWNFV